jgi:Arc/MetJ-type ribon-helix-helix transcriptional regulator
MYGLNNGIRGEGILMTKYINISLPENLIIEIREQMEDFGYTSITEFIKESVRQRLIDVKNYNNLDEIVNEYLKQHPNRRFEAVGTMNKILDDFLGE